MHTKTSINYEVNKHVNGYMINTVPGETNCQKVAKFQEKLVTQFGDTLWLTPSQHYTLRSWTG